MNLKNVRKGSRHADASHTASEPRPCQSETANCARHEAVQRLHVKCDTIRRGQPKEVQDYVASKVRCRLGTPKM
jgi:hypothetical protein